MKVGDLVKSVADQFEAEKVLTDWGEFHTDLGIVVKKSGGQVWVQWVSDNLLQWTPKHNLEVINESR